MKKDRTNKYLMIYYRNGLLYSTDYGDDKRVEHYLKQGFTVAMFDDREHVVEAMKDYKRMMNDKW